MAMNFLNFKVNKALTVTVEKSNAKSFNINSGSSSIPHYKKKATGGEDSFLVCEDLLMVADGVGGWAGKGIDPGEYSRELRDHIKEEYEKRKNFNLDENEVKSSLVEAVKRTKSTGSSTCVLLLLNQETKKLHATYVGDSLYMILRFNDNKSKFEVVHKSNEQQHRFNQPFQVGTNGDNPSLAVMESHDVQDKDLVITASDGLWDNLFDEMILELVNTQTLKEEKKIKDCNELAGRLAVEAEKYSLDVNYESPFAKRARAKGIEYYGGKEDDITVIVTQIDQIQETMTLNNNEENHIL
eukprot:CAMPEP_0170516210 /NCGR_PEP_ID=MMETSP0209-20121228/2493_1 /TAXON_ID=665100 ORGANISM="Litonotus pictus, Strain P1" /NCGR_SAMPLE_ID=MMETSP0209 /ASSEMBLY_ACC=CAM_ASM_000301 /LENGTH=297 /DNA_ID=CAMNT_0010801013 /DNA_START=146 /DNA_END=1039 /DNA_ORIENTATION=-